MRTTIFSTLLLFGFFLTSIESIAQELEVTVTAIRNDKGGLMIGLFNSEKTFTKAIFKGETPKAKNGDVTVVFRNLPPGEYAVSVFHDENDSKKLDTNFMGIPKEGFGFSNDAMGTFGPPSFDKAKFTLPQTRTIKIKMKYM